MVKRQEQFFSPPRGGEKSGQNGSKDGLYESLDGFAEPHLSLYELNCMVRDTLSRAMPHEYWVTAELSELRESRGHCYMELIQKDPRSNTPVARASAKCWRNTWTLVSACFTRATEQTLAPGMKVLLRVAAQFHESFGFSWIITDIDPAFTIGDMARRRQEIIARLKEEGVFELNKELELSPFTSNVAVISAPTAAGYGDFCNQLAYNAYGFGFKTELFAAVMQGEKVEQSIVAALNMINERADEFDCVVIIRGGGATSDLSGFDSLTLAENIANFPLPVITGIGHERDETVADMVAHTRVKTPTAAAALLIDNLKAVLDRIEYARMRITAITGQLMKSERTRIERLAERIPVLFSLVKTRRTAETDAIMARLRMAATARLTAERHKIELLKQKAEAADPAMLLKRGYSITLLDGRVVTDAKTLKEGDIIETRLKRGTVKSRVGK